MLALRNVNDSSGLWLCEMAGIEVTDYSSKPTPVPIVSDPKANVFTVKCH